MFCLEITLLHVFGVRSYVSLLDDGELSDDDDVSLQMALEESARYLKSITIALLS